MKDQLIQKHLEAVKSNTAKVRTLPGYRYNELDLMVAHSCAQISIDYAEEKDKEIEKLKWDCGKLMTEYLALQSKLSEYEKALNGCTHDNTVFQNIRCNVCSDCGEIIEIDV